MNITLDLWQVVSFSGVVLGAFWGMAKFIALQMKANIESQFKSLGEKMEAQANHTARLEREVMELKAELPRDYVRREDWTRVIASFEVKVDNLRLTIERMMLSMGEKR